MIVAKTISLPLMGIRNQTGLPFPCSALPLTTPHGDQERGDARTKVSTRPSHYPSWGSGTSSTDFPNATHFASLPLMGIRNLADMWRRAGRAAAHYPSWGSGTPSQDRTPSRQRRTHYPSWGSGTATGGPTTGHTHDISLPLMGIRNRSQRIPRRWDPCTHYPSWGSGTFADMWRRAGRLATHYPSWGSGTIGP